MSCVLSEEIVRSEENAAQFSSSSLYEAIAVQIGSLAGSGATLCAKRANAHILLEENGSPTVLTVGIALRLLTSGNPSTWEWTSQPSNAKP